MEDALDCCPASTKLTSSLPRTKACMARPPVTESQSFSVGNFRLGSFSRRSTSSRCPHACLSEQTPSFTRISTHEKKNTQLLINDTSNIISSHPQFYLRRKTFSNKHKNSIHNFLTYKIPKPRCRRSKVKVESRCFYISGGSINFVKGKTVYQPRRHLSRMHTTNYLPFIWEKVAYFKKLWANKGGSYPHPFTFESATASHQKLRLVGLLNTKQVYLQTKTCPVRMESRQESAPRQQHWAVQNTSERSQRYRPRALCCS